MRDRKFETNWWYGPADGADLAAHLERMHRKGWHLEKLTNVGRHYRRGGPETVHYAVTCFPGASVFDPGPTEGQRTYAEYCAAAGWEFVSAYGPIQVFRSRAERPIPVETDERQRLRAVNKTMWRTQGPGWGFVAVMEALLVWSTVKAIRWNTLTWVTSSAVFSTYLLAGLILLYLLTDVGGYCLWYVRSRLSTARGGRCAKWGGRFHRWAQGLVLAASALWTAYRVLFHENGMVVLIWMLTYAALLVVCQRLLWAMKDRGYNRNDTRGTYVLVAIAAGVAFSAGMGFVESRAEEWGLTRGHVTETYTYTNAAGKERTTIHYRDELPLTLADLGVEPRADVDYSCHAERDGTPLAWHGDYYQYCQGDIYWPDSPPQIDYEVTVFRRPWVRDWCLERIVNEAYFSYTPVEEPAWGAEQVYRMDSSGDHLWYFVVYPDRFVDLWAEGLGSELTEDQIAVVAEKLGK